MSKAYLSWSGFNIQGDEKSIEAVKQALHEAGTVPILKEIIKNWQALYSAQEEVLKKLENV